MAKINAKITKKFEDSNKVIQAYADVTIDDTFVVHGYTVKNGKNGIYADPPQKSYEKDGKTVYTDIFHAITAEGRQAINDAVIAAYNAE